MILEPSVTVGVNSRIVEMLYYCPRFKPDLLTLMCPVAIGLHNGVAGLYSCAGSSRYNGWHAKWGWQNAVSFHCPKSHIERSQQGNLDKLACVFWLQEWVVV